MQKLTTFLWFKENAEQAVKFYTAIFKRSQAGSITRYPKELAARTGQPAGSVMTVSFRIAGQEFVALNGGPLFHFNESVSFVVNCRTAREVDYYWQRRSARGGRKGRCGWLKDRFGVSWQVVPLGLHPLMKSKDAAKSRRVTQAMLRMGKLDIKRLKAAAKGN